MGEHDSFIIEYNGERKLVKQMNAKEIYWILIGDNIVYPWKRKWNEILNMDVLNWEKIWGNVHDNYLPYRVQSSMWEIVNLNYISSFSLNVMYNSPNICCHCKKIEEGPAHTILYCEISSKVYNFFTTILNRLSDQDLTLNGNCFGILFKNKNNDKKERLRNYIVAFIKHVIFKRRAFSFNLGTGEISKLLIDQIRKMIKVDLNNKYIISKENNEIATFRRKFLIENIVGHLDDENLILIL